VVDAEAAGVQGGAVHREHAGFDEAVGQHAAGDHALGRQVGQQRAESDGHEEKRFKFLVDAEVKQNGADDPHDHHLPGDGGEGGQLEKRAEVAGNVDEDIHRTLREA
jgi:hypothetical protein